MDQCCIICSKKVRIRKGDHHADLTGKLKDNRSEEEDEIAPKSVITAPAFLRSFNEIWGLLQNTSGNGNGSPQRPLISLETVAREGEDGPFTKNPPTMCQRCCGKVVAIRNLINALRYQFWEIKRLLDESSPKRKEETSLEPLEESLTDNSFEENNDNDPHSDDDIQVKEEDEESNLEHQKDLPSLALFSSETLESPMDCEDNGGDAVMSADEDNIKLEQDKDNQYEKYLKEFKPEVRLLQAAKRKKRKKLEPKPDSLSKPFPCSEASCSRRFNSKRGLRSHIVRFHPNKFGSELVNSQDNHFPCSCGMTFKSNGRRMTHMRSNKREHSNLTPQMISSLGKSQKCDLCQESIPFAAIFEHYTTAHLNGQGEYVVKCPNLNCPYLFVTSSRLRRHIGACREQVVQKNKVDLTCDTCGFTRDSALSVRNHVENVHELLNSEKRLKCPVSDCGKMFCVKQSVHFHFEVHQTKQITTQKCDKCGEDINVQEMEGHLKDKHGILEVDVIGCKQCEFKFSERDDLVEHLFEHRHMGIICDICGDEDNPVKYLRYRDFREHYFGVHGICDKIKCGQCNGLFWSKKTLKYHVLKDHKEGKVEVKVKPRKRFKCELCFEESSVSFELEHELISHKIKVHGMAPFTCDICGKTFSLKGDLTRHLREHAGVELKEWKCEVEGCGRTFRRKCHLRQHMEILHLGVKKFVCDSCGKSFGSNKGLKNHNDSVHLGLRPWVCEECGDAFTNIKVLQVHQLIHTGERPFECQFCGQRFRQKVALTTHVKGHEEKGAAFRPVGAMKGIRKRKAQ